MLFKLVVVISLIQSFTAGELAVQNPTKANQNNRDQSLSNKESLLNILNNTIDFGSVKDPCPDNQSLHSRSDLKDLIDFVYEQLSIDEKIRKKYQSTALAHRDKYIKDIKQFEEWLQEQPQHLKHVLESLSRIREDIIEPDVKKIVKLLQDNSRLLHVYDEKNKTFYNLKKKLQRYKTMCSFNCDEDYINEAHVLFKRNIQDDYICSSLKDLYDKIQERMSQFLEYFSRESINRFSKEDAKYGEKIKKITKSIRDKGLQKMSTPIYDILILQDEYHHFVEKLNYSAILEQINYVQNLSIQVDAHMLELTEVIEKYGRHCQNCRNEPILRHVRQVVATNPEKGKDNSKSILDYLLDEKLNETATKVKHDWDNIFKEVLDLIDENKNKHLNLEEFDKMKDEVNKITLLEQQALDTLNSNTLDTGVEDIAKLAKLLTDLILTIKELIAQFKTV